MERKKERKNLVDVFRKIELGRIVHHRGGREVRERLELANEALRLLQIGHERRGLACRRFDTNRERLIGLPQRDAQCVQTRLLLGLFRSVHFQVARGLLSSSAVERADGRHRRPRAILRHLSLALAATGIRCHCSATAVPVRHWQCLRPTPRACSVVSRGQLAANIDSSPWRFFLLGAFKIYHFTIDHF